MSIAGLLYAVVLAFLVAAAWTAFDTAQRTADAEASDVAENFVTAVTLPEPARSRLRALMADYAFEVKDREWEMLGGGEQDPRARQLMLQAFETVALMPTPSNAPLPDALHRESVRQVLLTNLHDLGTKRRERLLDAARHIPEALYLALIFGWILLTAFIFLFGVTRRALQLAMTALVTAMIGLLLGVIVEFDFPYGHGVRVTDADAWTLIIHNNHLAAFRSKIEAREETGRPALASAGGQEAPGSLGVGLCVGLFGERGSATLAGRRSSARSRASSRSLAWSRWRGSRRSRACQTLATVEERPQCPRRGCSSGSTRRTILSSTGRSPRHGTLRRTGQISASPAIVDGVLYVGTNGGSLYAIDAASGTSAGRFAHKTD